MKDHADGADGGQIDLLGEDEPAPYEIYNPDGTADVLLLCDHARNFIPRALDQLGLAPEHLERHIAYDIGIAPVTRRLAEALDAVAVLSTFSRLIVDPNRRLDDPTLIPAVADGTIVPGNRDLDRDAVMARFAYFYRPYHRAIAAKLDAMRRDGRYPALISMHSFTPVMHGRLRPWEVGILWSLDSRLPVPLIQALSARGHCVGDNEPYSGRGDHGYTQQIHGDQRGLANVLIELRQDLIDTRHGQLAWADILVEVLHDILKDSELYRARTD